MLGLKHIMILIMHACVGRCGYPLQVELSWASLKPFPSVHLQVPALGSQQMSNVCSPRYGVSSMILCMSSQCAALNDLKVRWLVYAAAGTL